jgi:hypothetical protein
MLQHGILKKLLASEQLTKAQRYDEALRSSDGPSVASITPISTDQTGEPLPSICLELLRSTYNVTGQRSFGVVGSGRTTIGRVSNLESCPDDISLELLRRDR